MYAQSKFLGVTEDNFLSIPTRAKAQLTAVLLRTRLNNVVQPTLFIVANNIEQY